MTKKEPIQKIVIAGGGTAGWLAAATLGNIFKDKKDVAVELVESDEIGIIGVGEATIPPLLASIESLGIDLVDFIQATQATFKWGIRFDDWLKSNHSYFHPFGQLGKAIDGHDFFQCWLHTCALGDKTPLMAHSPEAILAEKNKFFLPFDVANTPLAHAQYALHLDAALVSKYLRSFSQQIGVIRTEGNIESVGLTSSGNINKLTLIDGTEISGDFFIDCTGFRGVLIEGALNAGYENWSSFLPCNKAVTVQSKSTHPITPYTIATAREAGWTWRIPLQQRVGNGYVYCDKYMSDEQATQTLLSALDSEPLTTPRVIPFTTGIRKKPWHRNCLSLGLAQGFLEPLESTAIHLVSKTLALFVRMFPDQIDKQSPTTQVLMTEFNRRVLQDYVEIRDFLILHYQATQRTDTAFWRDCQNMVLPETLKHKIELFQSSGNLQPGVEELFQPTSWYAVLNGMNIHPTRYNPTVKALDEQQLLKSLNKGKTAILQAVDKQPMHDQFIKAYCHASEM